jgi:hypothetical protein
MEDGNKFSGRGEVYKPLPENLLAPTSAFVKGSIHICPKIPFKLIAYSYKSWAFKKGYAENRWWARCLAHLREHSGLQQ